jgi:hypothetical protein
VGSFFFFATIITIWEGLGFFFLATISILTFLSLLAIQAHCPKAYKSTTTNSFEIIISLSM